MLEVFQITHQSFVYHNSIVGIDMRDGSENLT